MDRLQKIIAAAGIASRRKAEEMIKEGRVKVNDQIVTEMGFIPNKHDVIKVDDIVVTKEEKKYYCLYKPRNIISSVNDEHNRTTVIDILPDSLKTERLFPVGRLDYDTKGVILITNDGDFMNKMVGPKSGIEKEYLVRIKGFLSREEVLSLNEGLQVGKTHYLPAIVNVESVDHKNQSSLVRVIITEGQYHQVKLMFEALKHPVKRLTRVRFGCITLENMREGEIRPLTIHEVKTLLELAKKDKVLIPPKKIKIRY